MKKFKSKVRQTVDKTRKAKKILLISEEGIELMTDDALITLVKHEKKGYDSRIQDLEACFEEMMSLANVMGRRISSRKRGVCGELAEEAQNVAESAEESMASMQSLVRRRQLTLNPINSEVAKVSKVIKFEGNSYPHFFTWKRDALAATTEVGIPLAN